MMTTTRRRFPAGRAISMGVVRTMKALEDVTFIATTLRDAVKASKKQQVSAPAEVQHRFTFHSALTSR